MKAGDVEWVYNAVRGKDARCEIRESSGLWCDVAAKWTVLINRRQTAGSPATSLMYQICDAHGDLVDRRLSDGGKFPGEHRSAPVRQAQKHRSGRGGGPLGWVGDAIDSAVDAIFDW